jgi:NADPH:quinone reductase-like Zn-dependent oxidoreductase
LDHNGTMRAITYARYGPPDVLELAEVATPVAKDDEVLIRVRAAEATNMVPGSSFSACINAFRPQGRYLAGNARLSTMLRCVWTTRFTDKTCRVAPARETTEALLVLKQMIEDETIGSIVDAFYPMQQAVAAHRRVDTEQRVGAT